MNKLLKVQISTLPFFRLESLRVQSKESVLPFLKYQKKKGNILSLKKGVYVSSDFIEREKLKGIFETYSEFIANKLIEPSYLSLGYILSKYSLLTEAIYELTSLTLKTPRRIINPLGSFSYFKIKKPLFCGYQVIKRGEYHVREATKSKSLFDFLYFQKRGLKKIDQKFVKELRLNLDEMKKNDWLELEKYVNLSGSKKMRKIFALLKQDD